MPELALLPGDFLLDSRGSKADPWGRVGLFDRDRRVFADWRLPAPLPGQASLPKVLAVEEARKFCLVSRTFSGWLREFFDVQRDLGAAAVPVRLFLGRPEDTRSVLRSRRAGRVKVPHHVTIPQALYRGDWALRPSPLRRPASNPNPPTRNRDETGGSLGPPFFSLHLN